MIGTRFGRLVVVAFSHRDDYSRAYWTCRCDCNTEIAARQDALKKGHYRSCGCLAREHSAERLRTHGHTPRGEWSPTYITWNGMMGRCYDPKNASYPYYGDKGIVVCERWHKFENFLEDMGERPEERTLDRIDNLRGYSPDNCRWATHDEQVANRR